MKNSTDNTFISSSSLKFEIFICCPSVIFSKTAFKKNKNVSMSKCWHQLRHRSKKNSASRSYIIPALDLVSNFCICLCRTISSLALTYSDSASESSSLSMSDSDCSSITSYSFFLLFSRSRSIFQSCSADSFADLISKFKISDF